MGSSEESLDKICSLNGCNPVAAGSVRESPSSVDPVESHIDHTQRILHHQPAVDRTAYGLVELPSEYPIVHVNSAQNY